MSIVCYFLKLSRSYCVYKTDFLAHIFKTIMILKLNKTCIVYTDSGVQTMNFNYRTICSLLRHIQLKYILQLVTMKLHFNRAANLFPLN